MQSVVNAAARLTADARKYDHVTQLLMDLHWLRVPQRIQYKLCVLVHGCLNGTAPGYLSDLTVSVASAARRQLRSASTSDLVVPSTRRASIGDHAFAVAGPRAWNSLSPALRSTSTSFIKKNLNHFCLDCHSVCDNVYCLLTMFSALAAVCTVYCAIEIVLITLPPGSNTKENPGVAAERNMKNHGQELALLVYSPNSGFDAILG